jgi:cytochrome c
VRTPALLLAALLALPGVAAAQDEEALIVNGRAFAEENCARCHAVGPTGDSPLEAAPPFRRFQTMWPLESLEEALGEGIVVGHPDMPAFELESFEIDALIAYLGSLPAD